MPRKDPDKRPSSARDLQARLKAISVTLPWTLERAEQWWSSPAPSVASKLSVADVLLSQESASAARDWASARLIVS